MVPYPQVARAVELWADSVLWMDVDNMYDRTFIEISHYIITTLGHDRLMIPESYLPW